MYEESDAFLHRCMCVCLELQVLKFKIVRSLSCGVCVSVYMLGITLVKVQNGEDVKLWGLLIATFYVNGL